MKQMLQIQWVSIAEDQGSVVVSNIKVYLTFTHIADVLLMYYMLYFTTYQTLMSVLPNCHVHTLRFKPLTFIHF